MKCTLLASNVFVLLFLPVSVFIIELRNNSSQLNRLPTMKLPYLLIAITLLFTACDQELALEDTILENEVQFKDIVKSIHGRAIENAEVSIYAGNKRFHDKTDENGEYNILIPYDSISQKGVLAMNIVHSLYRPQTVSYELPLISGETYNANRQSLSACPNCLKILHENASELFHLGDDLYNGAANSQFQKASDGLELLFEFNNSMFYDSLQLSFEAKGLESFYFDVPSSIQFQMGGDTLFLSESPGNGSFGNYTFKIKNDESYDSFLIKTVFETGLTYDDWEFSSMSLEGI